MHDLLRSYRRAAISISNTASSRTASRYPTVFDWPSLRVCSNALTNQARVVVSVSLPNVWSNVLPSLIRRRSHYRIGTSFAPYMLGLSYTPLAFLSQVPLKGFTGSVICVTNIVPGALLLLPFLPHRRAPVHSPQRYQRACYAQPRLEQSLQHLTRFNGYGARHTCEHMAARASSNPFVYQLVQLRCSAHTGL